MSFKTEPNSQTSKSYTKVQIMLIILLIFYAHKHKVLHTKNLEFRSTV